MWLIAFLLSVLCLSLNSELVECETDVCGKYAILTKIDEFYISQPFSQKIAIDFVEFSQAFDSIKLNILKFEDIAKNYSKIENLKAIENLPLIPFTPEKNLIKIQADHAELPRNCQKYNAQLLTIEPSEKPLLAKIMKQIGIDTAPLFSIAVSKSLHSPNFKVLDSPEDDTKSKLQSVGNEFFPYFSAADKIIRYTRRGNNTSTVVAPALCSKSNNFWDRSPYMKFFTKTVQSILRTIQPLKQLSELTENVFSVFNGLSKPQAQVISDNYIIPAPVILTKISSFLQKFNNIKNWENSKPTEISDFLDYIKNFKELNKHYNQRNLNTKKHQFFDFLQNTSATIDFDEGDQRLLMHLGLSPDRFGISGPVQVRPLQSIGHSNNRNQEENTTSIYAEVSFRLFDRLDLAKIYDVKPLIFNNNKITTTKYLVGLVRHAQASLEEPTPINCIKKEEDEIKICDGFQTPGINIEQPSNSLSCGRALMSANDTINIDKCPTTAAPDEALAYRAECVPGVRSVVLSSVRPLKISIDCDTTESLANIFENFPVTINTECAVKETRNEVTKILLPQLQDNFYQDQKVGGISIYRPPVLTANNSNGPLSTTALIILATIGATLVSVILSIVMLAIFDPAKCLNASKLMCCGMIKLFYCCQNCCKECCKCKPIPDENERERDNQRRMRNYYPSQTSIPSAPPDDIAMQSFLPKTPVTLSRNPSIHDIKQAEPRKSQQSARVFSR